MKRCSMLLLGLLTVGITSRSLAARGDNPDSYRDGYQAGDYGRVRYLERGATILRGTWQTGVDAEDTATANTPVFPGDTVRTDGTQRAEVQLAGGTLVRLDRGTDLTFQALPGSQTSPTDNSVLKLSLGTLQVSARLSEGGDFRVDTPVSSLYFLSSGEFRIDVDPAGRTRVQSRRGVLEVSCNEGSVLVRGGMRTVAHPNSVPDDPRPFNLHSAHRAAISAEFIS